jgi:hypothetical protein
MFLLSLKVGDKLLSLHNTNKGMQFYYKIQLQL